MENLDKTLRDFCQSHDENYIYGAGYIATMLYYRLKHLGITIAGFVSTLGGDTRCNMKVLPAKEIMRLHPSAGFILGMNRIYQKEVKMQFPEIINYLEMTEERLELLQVSLEEDNAQKTYDRKFSYYDWWRPFSAEAAWFTRFVRHHFPNTEVDFHFYSVFGTGEAVKQKTDGIKIFFSGECLGNYPGNRYGLKERPEGNCLPYVNLSLSFEESDVGGYLRFPLWILYVFEPEWGLDGYKQRLKQITNLRNTRKEPCVCICRHDAFGTRSMIYEKIKDVMEVKFPGKWNHNTDDLWTIYHDDKRAYLREFRFNICAEHFNFPGYCTEKIFDAFLSGTVPLYYGADNRPEPEVINPQAIIFFSPDSGDSVSRKLIYDMEDNEKLYEEFVAQERFKPKAAEFIYETYINPLCSSFSRLISKQKGDGYGRI